MPKTYSVIEYRQVYREILKLQERLRVLRCDMPREEKYLAEELAIKDLQTELELELNTLQGDAGAAPPGPKAFR